VTGKLRRHIYNPVREWISWVREPLGGNSACVVVPGSRVRRLFDTDGS
jgi:hypothetical protein